MKDLSAATLAAHAAWLRDPATGARADLRGVNLRGASLRSADLVGADLRRADMHGADLRDVDLRRAKLFGADLADADLRGAKLAYADLPWADLSDANLRGADLTRADLHGADLRGADLAEANLATANLRGVTGDGVVIQSLHLPRYPVAITGDSMQIGCQRHTIADWLAFDDVAIARMDSGALDWWRRWKPTIASAIAARQCLQEDSTDAR